MSAALEIQKALIARGFGVGPSGADGIIGPDTERAIVAFKRSIGLRARPYLGPITLKALLDLKSVPKVAVEVPNGEPRWLSFARRYSGLSEIKGSRHAPEILEMWETLGIPIADDETAWCAAFVGFCLESAGISSSGKASARSYEAWGVSLDRPVPGCVVTKKRGGSSWQGHVFFAVGRDQKGRILGLGGNQDDAVNIKAFDPKDPGGPITGYFWPAGEPLPDGTLPKSNLNVTASSKED